LREAAYWFEEAGATYPRYGTAFDNLGQVYGALGLYREAESAFRTAHETNPEHGGHRYDLAAYLMNRGNMLTAECRISEAKSMLTEGVSLYPHGRGYYLLGRALIESGEIGEAKAAFEKALQTDPVQPDARIELDRLARLDRSTR
jgi:tetratricopeptide (TPR) repeat protein